MTAPTINGTRYPQPVEDLMPAARKLTAELGTVPSRNRLMSAFRIGAPKATELRTRLIEEKAREIATREHEIRRRLAEQFGYTPPDERTNDGDSGPGDGGPVNAVAPPADPWDYAEPIGPEPAPAEPIGPEPAPAETTDRAETARAAMIRRGALLPPAGTSWTDPVTPEPAPPAAPDPAPAPEITPADPPAEVSTVGHPDTPTLPESAAPSRPAVVWPVVLLALPAFVAIWSGWVGLGGLTGFGVVHPLPGIWDSFSINSAITLPIGVETYGAYALYVWLSGRVPDRARRFAKWSAIASLLVGALGQVAYHLLEAAGVTAAPWWITTAVACLPVAVLGMGAALAHLVRSHD